MERNISGWFEIPVTDMNRAISFYETVFDGIKLDLHELGPLEMAWFPMENGKPGAPGALVKHEDFYKPSTDGVLLYLSSLKDDIQDELSRVEAAGGEILVPRKQISPDYGYMAVIKDTEGNRIAFHSSK